MYVLGRYGFDRDLVPRVNLPDVEVTFRTVHSSKGLEADYVILPNLNTGAYGFPSNIQDDPVLDLAMADAEPYPHAEERRLFYVALTRARREVALVAVAGQESAFVLELVQDGKLVAGRGDDEVPVRLCPGCGQGALTARTGPYGTFLGCSTFPRCRHTKRAS